MKRHRTTSKERMTEFCRDVTSHGEQGAHDGFRREATSRGVRNNRNPTQVPEAARRVGKMPLSHSARRRAT